jgi:hypothetical protein
MVQVGIIQTSEYFMPDENFAMLYFSLTFQKTKTTLVLLWILLVSLYPLSKLRVSTLNANNVSNLFFYLHSGGWNQGPLDTAAT